MKTQLHAMLAELVTQYGRDKVAEALEEIHDSTKRVRIARKRKDIDAPENLKTGDLKIASSSIPTAVRYISKLDIASEKMREVMLLAQKFDRKKFLPNFGEVRNFCEIYGLKVPPSKSRIGAVPVVFRFLITLDSSDLRKLLFESAYTGPSELGPIADAIRGSFEQRAYRRDIVKEKSASNSLPEEKNLPEHKDKKD